MVRLLRRRQTKGPVIDRLPLPHRATSGLHLFGVMVRHLYDFPTTDGMGVRATSFWHPATIVRCILPARGGTMLQQVNQTEARDLEWSCQAVSPMDDPCDSVATVHCGICGRWFCAVHAEDESWHTCVLEPGDEGGEA